MKPQAVDFRQPNFHQASALPAMEETCYAEPTFPHKGQGRTRLSQESSVP